MFDDLRDLYQEIIIDRARHPRHAKRPLRADREAKGDNPLCGDRLTLWLAHTPEGRIAEAGFEAKGCAISLASADLMAEAVAGLTPEEAEILADAVQHLARTGETKELPPALAERFETLLPLGGVHEFPSRVKCATLAWHALRAALGRKDEEASA
jgi:nitrogen fixation NifU-like protein